MFGHLASMLRYVLTSSTTNNPCLVSRLQSPEYEYLSIVSHLPESTPISNLVSQDSSLNPNPQCAYGPGGGTIERSGTSVATPQVAGLAAILMVAYGINTASQVKETIVGLAHSRNGGPNAIYVGNPGDYCQTRRKRGTRWDAKRAVQSVDGISACEIELSGTATGATATATSRVAVSSLVASTTTPSSTLAKLSSSSSFTSSSSSSSFTFSSTPPADTPAQTSTAAVPEITLSTLKCNDRAWYDDESYCDSKCPYACTEVVDHFANEFPSFVCECK